MSTVRIDPPGHRPGLATQYSSMQIALHWTIAVLILVNWLLGEGMAEVFDARLEGEAVVSSGPAYVHIIIGALVFVLMALRLGLRLRRPVEVGGATRHPLLARIAGATHWLFYALVLAIPLGGALAWFGGSESAGELHGFAVDVLVVLAVLHVAGGVLHLILGENIFRRMARPG